MEDRSFDRLARIFSAAGSRRDALRAVLGIVVFGAVPSVVDAKKRGQTGKRHNRRGKGNGRRSDNDKSTGNTRNQRRDRKKASAEALPGGCCSSGNCTPGAGKNLAKCCYEGQDLTARNFKGANLGTANFSGATLTNANFSSANLDKACFVDANLTGARLAGTNTGTAIFCRSTMPDGSTNNSGCEKGTKCCPTCELPCPNGQRCCGNGSCQECCSDAHCAGGLSCNDGVCGACIPDCENRECGPDGCGSTCGDGCVAPDACNNRTGQCVCQPDCDGKSCGPDGCDGECEPGCSGADPICTADGQCIQCVMAGDCPDPGPCRTRACIDNTCQPETADDSTNPRNACPGAQVCCSGACANCCTPSDCTPPANGTVTCSQGICQKICDNNIHRICGPGAGVCQECCGDDRQCQSLNGTCVDGTCECPGANESRCGMDCIDLSIEPNHCGACGRSCASGTCINGQCREPEPCGFTCPPHIPDCELDQQFCPGNRECSRAINGICTCPDGMVDCDGDGVCEACGRCGVTACPPDPDSGDPGFCCAGGYCSCGGICCGGPECWITTQTDGEGSPIGQQEHCDNTSGCVDCWGQCCSACINGNCASSGPIRGGSIRRG